MMGVADNDDDDHHPEFVEFDPTGRYGRYSEILGKGASKLVYRAFDEYEGIEVAWNQVKLNDFLQSPEELERLYCEIHLLKTLKHKHIMKFYTSWVDIAKRNINFVTELFTSGTLRQYRKRHRRVHIRAVKHWCRQILKGLFYLHSHDPPIIHRDLKCDNIFINGNQGVVKIGDLGLAAILRKSHAAHCVGTPEFMAPEVYQEQYNELVDIYSFGMCVLEMVTSEYPYSECNHPAQIYLKVITGTKPEALAKVKDPEVRQFVEKCLVTASRRLSARELLMDPFLQIDDHGSGSWEGDISEICQILRQPSYVLDSNGSLIANGAVDDHTENGWGYSDLEMSHIQRHPSFNLLQSDDSVVSNGFAYDPPYELLGENGWDYNAPGLGAQPFSSEEDEASDNMDITIKGTRGEDGGIFMRLRIPDEEGRIQNIYFPFDTETDTALDVANEMVGELDITDYDVTRIAEMIDGEVSSLAPEQKLDSQSEHIAYHVVGSGQAMSEGVSALSTSQEEVLDMSFHTSRESNSDDEGNQFDLSIGHEKEIHVDRKLQTSTRERVDQLNSNSIHHQSSETDQSRFQCPPPSISNNCESRVRKELRRLNAIQLSAQKDNINQQFDDKVLNPLPDSYHRESRVETGVIVSTPRVSLKASNEKLRTSFNSGKRFSFKIAPRRNLLQTSKSFADHTDYDHSSRLDVGTQRAQHCKNPGSSHEDMFTAKSFYAGFHLPSSLPRTNSLPQCAAREI